MADSLSLRDLLSLPTDDPSIRTRRGLPTGHYIGEITAHEWGQSSQKKTDFVRYSIARIEPTADVTEDTSDIDFSRIELRADFYITPDAMFMIRDTLNNVLGLQPGITFDQRIPQMVGARIQFKASPEARRQEDGTTALTGFTSVDNRSLVAAA